MHWQNWAYLRYTKIRDDLIRGAFKKLLCNPFDFVPEFQDFIFYPWTPTSDTRRDDSTTPKEGTAHKEDHEEVEKIFENEDSKK